MFPFRFDASPDELLGAIDHLQEVVACVRRDAGSCVTPEHERMLHALTLTIQRHEATFGVLETDVQKRVMPGAMTHR